MYEALYWLNKFISYFEKDYNRWLEDCKDMLAEPNENLSEEDLELKKEQKQFMNKMFQQQFPDIIEIILIYSQRKLF